MRFLYLPEGSVALRAGTGEGAVRQVSGSDLRAGQVLHVPEVQLVAAVVEHVDHFVCQNALHHAVACRHILADNDLFGVVRVKI